MNKENLNQALEALKIALTEEESTPAHVSITFKDKIHGKGLFWAGNDYTKQIALFGDPDRIFISEHVDIAKGKELQINGVKALDETSIGAGITKSNLKEVGRLKGLIVDGSLSVNQYLHYDSSSDRLGIGTDQPNSALSIAEDGIEVGIGTDDFNTGYIGTFASHDFNLKTDDETRLTITASGDVKVKNNVKVAGKLAVGVNNPDPQVDLHVSGSIKFNGSVHLKGSEPPKGGTYNAGDITWNSNPQVNGQIGWVCVKAGNPGVWAPFGNIR